MADDQALQGQPPHLANGGRGRSQLLPYQPHGFTEHASSQKPGEIFIVQFLEGTHVHFAPTGAKRSFLRPRKHLKVLDHITKSLSLFPETHVCKGL